MHNFDSLTPLCACSIDKEDNEHFFLHCSQFYFMLQNLFGQLSDIPGLLLNLDDKSLCDLLPFGDSKYSVVTIEKYLKQRFLLSKIRKDFLIQIE